MTGRLRVLLLGALACAPPVSAGMGVWTTGGPYGGAIVAVAASAGTVYAAGRGSAFRSTDQGASWKPLDLVHVSAFAIDASDPATVYAGGRQGVLKSSDAGVTWSMTTIDGESRSIASITVDPSNRSTVYVVTLEVGLDFGPVFRSTDAGAHWGPLGIGASSIAIDPAHPSTIFAGGPNVWRSTDGGTTWTKRADVSASIVAFAPSRPSTVYAASYAGVFRSTDSGASWTARRPGLERVLAFAVDPTTPDRLYAVHDSNAFAASTDGGATWTAARARFDVAITGLALDPSAPSDLYLASDGVFRSTDGGLGWREVSHGVGARALNSVVCDPSSPSTAWATGRYEGLFRSTDAGATWGAKSDGFEGANAIAAAPGALHAAANGVFRSTDSGASWSRSPGLPQREFYALAVAPGDPRTLYAGDGNAIYHSTDGAESWRANGQLSYFTYGPLVVDPVSSATLYAAGYGGVSRSTDGGVTFGQNSAVFSRVDVRAIAIDPGEPRNVYAAARGWYADSPGGIFRSTDRGDTWSRTTAVGDAWGVAVDPRNHARLFASVSGRGLIVSTDFGDSWKPMNVGLPWAPDRIPLATLAVDSSGSTLLASVEFSGVWQMTPLPPGNYVAPGGDDAADGGPYSPWATLQHAANAARPGTTVYVREGTYRGRVVVSRSGTADAWLSFAALPGEKPVLDASGIPLGGGELDGAFHIQDAAYVRVSGLTVKSVGPGRQDCGFFVEDSQHVVLEKNVTDDTASSGIGVWGSADVTLDSNEVIRACHGGIQEQISVGGTTGFVVTNNRVHDAGGTPIGGEGICLKDGSSAGRVHGNSVWNVPERVGLYVDAWDKRTHDIEVDGNLVHECIDGIGLASEMGGLLEAIRVTNNVVYGNAQRGLFVADFGGVATHPMNDLLIANNTFVGNGTGGWGGGIAVDDPDARNVVVRNDLVAGSPSFSMIVSPSLPASAVAVDHNLIDVFHGDLGEGETRGTDFVEGDPRFVFPSAHDYHLAPDSPAIDKGNAARAPSADFDGNPRPSGAGADIGAFERQDGGGATSVLFVPVVLRTPGLAGSFFTSELTLTNRGAGFAKVSLAYTGTDGITGTAALALGAHRQLVVPDAIPWLRANGVPVPQEGNAVGTLRVTFTGLSAARDAGILVRTTTPVPPGAPTGAAGLSYAGVRLADLPTGPVFISGLRDDAHDRSNVAVQNAGGPADGLVTLRISLMPSGAPLGSVVMTRDGTLAPGGFFQMAVPGGFVGTAWVERLAGSAPFYAYGVINDRVNSDGSFVPAVPVAVLRSSSGITLPVVVENSTFSTEVVLANVSGAAERVHLALHADGLGNGEGGMTLELPATAQVSIPDFVAALRASGANVPTPIVGPVVVTWDGEADLFVAARTGNAGDGGRYSLFYTGAPPAASSSGGVWMDGLQQTDATRTNLAIVNTGEADATPDTFLVEVWDGTTGLKVGERSVTVAALRQLQINAVLTQIAPGTTNAYARVTRTSGTNPFIAYAVLNDGASPGERSGDGAWVTSQSAE